MLNKLFAFTIMCFSLFSAEKLPTFIDFGSQEFRNHFYQEEYSPEFMNLTPFNNAIEFSTFFQYLKKVYNIHTAIETGTYYGQTAKFFASLFETAHTIEISEVNFKISNNFLKDCPNIEVHLGDSPEVLKKILPTMENEPIVFYLDAHWYNYWPLLDELDVISKTHYDNCVIVVDDVMVPNRNDIAYDSYQGKACSYEYMKDKLDQIFSEASIHYLIPIKVQSRGKLVALPKSWME
jgi:hypothetical protein